MKTTKLSAEVIEFLESLENAFADPQAFVERWTDQKCFYEGVVMCIYDHLALWQIAHSPIRTPKLRSVIAAIVDSSPVGQIASFDESTGLFQYRETVSEETKNEVTNILIKDRRVIS